METPLSEGAIAPRNSANDFWQSPCDAVRRGFMFTPEEEPLLHGSDEEIDDFVDAARCLVIDWRGSEDEAVEDVIRFLPEGALSFETDFPEEDKVEIRLNYLGREEIITLPLQPQNNFRVLLRVADLLEPVYGIHLFRCTDSGDTQAFLLRPQEWWQAFREKYPQRFSEIFRPLGDLNKMWDLEKTPAAEPAKRRPWWKLS